MVVAVVAVRMVQMAIDEVINVVAMRYGFVSAAGAVYMSRFVAVAVMIRGADVRVGGADGDAVFINVVAVRVTAIRAVLVFVVGVVRFVAAAAAVVFAHV